MLALYEVLVLLCLFLVNLCLWRVNLLRLMLLAIVLLFFRIVDVVTLPSFIFTLVGCPAGNKRFNRLIDFQFGMLLCFTFSLL